MLDDCVEMLAGELHSGDGNNREMLEDHADHLLGQLENAPITITGMTITLILDYITIIQFPLLHTHLIVQQRQHIWINTFPLELRLGHLENIFVNPPLMIDLKRVSLISLSEYKSLIVSTSKYHNKLTINLLLL